MKAIGYVRCSTQEQADSGLGLAAQADRIRAYCTMKDLPLVDIIEDAAISGGKPLADRAGGRRLLEIIRKRHADAVVMLKLDRMFRNAADCLTTVEKWERSGVALHVVDLGGNAIDTASAAGRFMLVVLAGAAEMERNLIRERTKAAMDQKRRRQEQISPSAPYGYRFVLDRIEDRIVQGRRVDHPIYRLASEQDEQQVIVEMLTMRERGMSYQKIADALTERGIPTKRGNGTWNQATIRGILKRQQALERTGYA